MAWIMQIGSEAGFRRIDGRWTLADWDIVRRPRSQTTKAGRTGHFIGIPGFLTPLCNRDPAGRRAVTLTGRPSLSCLVPPLAAL
ncbi:hypothetical protein ACFZB5_34655 [Streptomyces nodosus]|uniref:hypothetical protein n=1 Tax=Streptomyces nodosus TaxID=40318 RepID=UPI0036ED845D